MADKNSPHLQRQQALHARRQAVTKRAFISQMQTFLGRITRGQTTVPGQYVSIPSYTGVPQVAPCGLQTYAAFRAARYEGDLAFECADFFFVLHYLQRSWPGISRACAVPVRLLVSRHAAALWLTVNN